MDGYNQFAAFYDRLTTDVGYAQRCRYLLSLFKKHGGKTQQLLDLACGSGSLTMELAAQGVDMIGVDGSEEMLAVAMEKNRLADCPALFLQQDMRELNLYGTVDGAVCTLDSLNHLCRTADIERVFQRLRLFVEPGGLFIFDVNTPYKHRSVLGNQIFVFEEPDFMCVWRNQLRERTCEVNMWLDFFVQQEDGSYERLQDVVHERAYSAATLRRLLQKTGWEVLAVYDDMTENDLPETAQRAVWVVRNTRTMAQARGEENE